MTEQMAIEERLPDESLKNAISVYETVVEATKDVEGEDDEYYNPVLDKVTIRFLKELQQYRAIGTVEEWQNAVKEEDVLKFYYIESEDKYVVGKRVDTLYYGEVGKTGLAFYMSRYLPWGEHIVDPTSAWKEHTYPSEPKEIPFFDWLQGFIRKECGGTIEELQALKEKKEQGLLLELPCKVGTEVYVIVDDCNGDVFDCMHDCEHCRDHFRGIETRTFSLYMFDAIGKDVFLTKEEAEQHLDWE